jgi:hypothetical protein
MSIQAKQRLLIGICLVAIGATLLAPRISQDPSYHLFADQNSFLSIPNALNVLSNLIFAWVGIEGLYRLRRQGTLQILGEIRIAYQAFFVALVLIAAGSIYYHWSPDNQSLAWDRLPMTFAFTAFLTILLAERVSLRAAKILFPALLTAGIASIAWWYRGELEGHGDLRFYALVQFLPVLLLPLILMLFKAEFSRETDIWLILAWYLAAKLCEAYDHEIYQWLGLISGHSLKHIAAGIGGLVFLRHLRFRARLA